MKNINIADYSENRAINGINSSSMKVILKCVKCKCLGRSGDDMDDAGYGYGPGERNYTATPFPAANVSPHLTTSERQAAEAIILAGG